MATARWSPIIEHGNNNGPLSGERLKYWQAIRAVNQPGSKKRRVIAPCGRRSLKSELPKRGLVLALTDPKPWPNPIYVAAGPTRDQIKRLAWADFKALVPKDWVAEIFETELRIVTKWGAELQCVGLDKPQRIEGKPLDGIWITERADIKAGAYDANIRPALADRRGWSIEEGTPDFDGPSAKEYEDAYNKAISGEDASSIAFTWSSESVLPREEIESMRNTLDDLYYQQEVGGLFVRLPDMAYYGFSLDKENGNVADVELDRAKTLYIDCDFNFGFHNWVTHQMHDKGLKVPECHVIDQIFVQNAEVETMCNTVDQWLLANEYAGQVVFYGDYAGEQRRAEATYSAWRQVRNRYPNAEFRYKVSPPISDRLRVVNTFICDAKGKRHLKVSPKCKELIEDFRYVTRAQLLSQTGKGGRRSHASDALGYGLREMDREHRWLETL